MQAGCLWLWGYDLTALFTKNISHLLFLIVVQSITEKVREGFP